jgi:hypothetical protein
MKDWNSLFKPWFVFFEISEMSDLFSLFDWLKKTLESGLLVIKGTAPRVDENPKLYFYDPKAFFDMKLLGYDYFIFKTFLSSSTLFLMSFLAFWNISLISLFIKVEGVAEAREYKSISLPASTMY